MHTHKYTKQSQIYKYNNIMVKMLHEAYRTSKKVKVRIYKFV